jgi:hypothetical protein
MAESKMVSIKTLKPNEKNPRKISDAAFEKLCASIKRDPIFMELRPMIVDEKSVIIGGNQRFQAIKKLGKKEIPETWVKRVHGLTAEQRKRFIVIDNSPEGAAGYWDFDILQEEWQLPELQEMGFVFPEKIDVNKEWKGMPDFDQERQNEYKMITVRFLNKKDYHKFATLIGRKLTDETKTIWFPKQDFDENNREKEYVES